MSFQQEQAIIWGSRREALLEYVRLEPLLNLPPHTLLKRNFVPFNTRNTPECVTFSPDGRFLIIGCQDEISIFDAWTNERLHRFNIEFLPVEVWLPTQDILLVLSHRTVMHILDVNTGKELQGKILSELKGKINLRIENGTANLTGESTSGETLTFTWDIKKSDTNVKATLELPSLKQEDFARSLIKNSDARVFRRRIALSPNGNEMATLNKSGLLGIYDMTRPVPEMIQKQKVRFTAAQKSVMALAPEGDCIFFASDEQKSFLNLQTGEHLKNQDELRNKEIIKVFWNEKNQPRALAWFLAQGEENNPRKNLILLDVENNQSIYLQKKFPKRNTLFALSIQGTYIAVANEKTLYIFDANSGEELLHKKLRHKIKGLSWGTEILALLLKGKYILLLETLDAQFREKLFSEMPDKPEFSSISLSPRDDKLALERGSPKHSETTIRILSLQDLEIYQDYTNKGGDTGFMAFTQDSSRLVYCNLAGNPKILELDGINFPTIRTGPINAAAISPDEQHFACIRQGMLRLNNMESRQLKESKKLDDTDTPDKSLCWSLDGKKLMTHLGSEVIIWDVDLLKKELDAS